MKTCRWCGEDLGKEGIGDFCSENCLLNQADDPRTTTEERAILLALRDAWLDQQGLPY